MTLANEAAYLYAYSKQFEKINKQLNQLSKEAGNYLEKHHKASSLEEQYKHRQSHEKTTSKIRDLLKKHDDTLVNLRRHQIAFANALQKEHRI